MREAKDLPVGHLLRLVRESWDTHGSLTGDNFETPRGASTLRRASQYQAGYRSVGGRLGP
jgi:hypothetical protein